MKSLDHLLPPGHGVEAAKAMSEKAITRLLLVEDDPLDASLMRDMLSRHGAHNIELTHVQYMRDAEKCLAERSVDIILLDLGLPDAKGLDAVRRARAAAPHVALVVLTGLEDESQAAQSLQAGAQEHLIKGQIDIRGLLRSLRYAVERKAMEDTLFVEKERAQVTLNCIGDGVACTDTAGNLTFLNRVAELMTGWSCHEATGRPISDVFQILDATTHESTPNVVRIALEQNRMTHLPPNCVLVRRDGTEIPIEDSIAPIHGREGQNRGAVIVFRDVSAARATALQLAHSAQHDFLTGLPNRMLLNDRIRQAIALAPRHTNKLAVMFLDLDGFKRINDTLGHSMGDRVLQSVAKRLLACVRGADTVSRQGGDEFVVLLSELEHLDDAARTAERMLKAVAEPHCVAEHELRVTTSIGISIYPGDGVDVETLLKNADAAMYEAKRKGRKNFQFFNRT